MVGGFSRNQQGKTPKRAFATSKSPQQRSDRTRKPVKSEQDSCSFDSIHRFELHSAGPVACFHVQCRSFLRTRLCQWLSLRMIVPIKDQTVQSTEIQ